MDDFESVPLGSQISYSSDSISASSSGYEAPSTSYAEERHLVPVENIQPRQPAPNHANKPQLPSKEQWKELEPLVQRWYIKEDRHLKDVLREIRLRKNFLITEKQMTTKLKDWNFRKNTTRTEREAVVLKGASPAQLEQMMGGRKLTGVKLERWQKAMNHGSNQSPPPNARRSAVVPELRDEGADVQMGVFSASTPSSKRVNFTQNFEVDGSLISLLSNSDALDPKIVMKPGDFTTDAWPFGPTEVQVVGSPKLSRLLAALKLEYPTDIDSFSLPEPAHPKPPQVTEYLTNSDLMDLYNTNDGNNDGRPRKGVIRYGSNNTTPQFPSARTKTQGTLPWRFPQRDIWFPSGIEIHPSPYNEVYLFPSPNSESTKNSVDNGTKMATLYRTETEWLEKLAKLQRLLPEDDPRILDTMTALARVYYDQAKYTQAEPWYRKVTSIKEVTESMISPSTLWAQLSPARILNVLDRNSEAEEILRRISPAFASQLRPSAPLLLAFLNGKINVALGMQDTQGVEGFCRAMLQIALATFGPRNPYTLSALRKLANALDNKRQTENSEKLFRTMMLLTNEVKGLREDDVIGSVCGLARALIQADHQARHTESIVLYRLALERAERVFGVGHRSTIYCLHQLAIALAQLGNIRESEQIFRDALQTLPTVLGEKHGQILNLMHDLGGMLYDDGRYGEAIPWLQKSFYGKLETTTPENRRTKHACKYFGLCYRRIDQYQDARELYIFYIDQIRASNGEAHPYIAEVRSWMGTLPDLVTVRQQDTEKYFYINSERLLHCWEDSTSLYTISQIQPLLPLIAP